MAKIAEYEDAPEDALYLTSLLDMRLPAGRGKDKQDGAVQNMGMYSKDSAFSRALKLQEALYKVQGRIAKIADRPAGAGGEPAADGAGAGAAGAAAHANHGRSGRTGPGGRGRHGGDGMMESILTVLLGGALLAAALLGGALAVPHPWGIVPVVLVIAGWTAACCFLAVTQLEMLGMLITATAAIVAAAAWEKAGGGNEALHQQGGGPVAGADGAAGAPAAGRGRDRGGPARPL